MLTAESLRHLVSYDASTGEFRWRIKPCPQLNAGDLAGCRNNEGYWQIRVLGKIYLGHRLAWLYMTGEWPRGLIDHRNLNRSDNRFDNLRVATKSKNAANSRAHKDGTSGYKGVHWSKQHKRWKAEICIEGKRRYIGLFDDPKEAAKAYTAQARIHFGEFARP
jgi:hypothetical protein